MQNRRFILILMAFLFPCSVDYDRGDSLIEEENRLVVNSILSSTEPIQVYFYTLSKSNTGYKCVAAKGVQVLLKENEDVLFDAVCTDTVLSLAHYPQTGASYRIEVFLTGYDKVQASLWITTYQLFENEEIIQYNEFIPII
jgi:hypothetical protein